MNQEYWVSVWAKRRQDEVVRIPESYKIHADFLQHMEKDEVQSAFVELNTLFQTIYGDMALRPDEYGMPLNLKDKHRVFSHEFSDSGQAPYRPFILLYNLSLLGEISDGGIVTSIEKYKAHKPPPKYLTGVSQNIKNHHFLFEKLMDYGFVFEGLKNNKLSNNDIITTYPDNPNLLHLFKLLADKAHKTDRIQDFLCCHFRLLQNNLETTDYGHGADDVADRITYAEKAFVHKFDETLKAMGFVSKPYGGIECHGVAYYHNDKDMNAKKPYTYRLITRGMDFENVNNEAEKMRLQLRLRNISNCREYLHSCSDSVKQIFTEYTDEGCAKRQNQTCKHGISYEIDSKAYWRCACCHAPFNVKPELTNILAYIKLVELGEKK